MTKKLFWFFSVVTFQILSFYILTKAIAIIIVITAIILYNIISEHFEKKIILAFLTKAVSTPIKYLGGKNKSGVGGFLTVLLGNCLRASLVELPTPIRIITTYSS